MLKHGIHFACKHTTARRNSYYRPGRLATTLLRNFTDMSGTGSLMDTVDKVQAKLQKSDGDGTAASWEDLWRDGLTPWDLGKPTPLLIDELEKMRSDSATKQRMRTLVPGCGTGYDLLTLQSHHNYVALHQRQKSIKSNDFESVVVGLDMSATALKSSEAMLKGHVSNTTRLELKCGDFFDAPKNWESVYLSRGEQDGENGGLNQVSEFDLIFDYTFFCALPPSLRSEWGKQMAKLLDPRTGRLLTVIFPILPGAEMKGPPYPVCPQDYSDALTPHGIIMDGEPFDSPSSVSSRAGKEMICYWKFDEGGGQSSAL